MQKIIINRCYGGFGLSPLAVKRLAELKGKQCYFFKHNDSLSQLIPISIEEAEKMLMWSAYSVPNPDEYVGRVNQKDWHSLTDREKIEINKKQEEIYLNCCPDKRDDPDLVKVVEELGGKADGSCASLKIVEVPDGVNWQIEEYDGREWVSEVHNTWS